MLRHEVDGDGPAFGELGEPVEPFVGAGRDRRASHLEAGVHVLDRVRGDLVQPVVGVLVGVLPEVAQVGFVPHLDRPGPHLVRAVAVDEVGERRAHQVGPLAQGAGRGDVAPPPEDRLLAGGQSGGHEPEFQERPDARVQVGVEHLVDVGEAVVDAADALVLVGAVDSHAVAEQAVAADVPEADVAPQQPEGVLVVAAQGEFGPAGADAGPPGVGEAARRFGRDADHPFSFVKRSRAVLCRSTSRSMFLAFSSVT